ncbi:MAG: head decoration protein [Magnetococcales bacterium]|nr:head decoration protein [Magnetococcales bacterium]
MPTYTMGNTINDILKYEDEQFFSREKITILAGSGSERVLKVGTVIGRLTKSTVTASAVTGTGGGSLASVSAGIKTQVGVYRIACVEAPTAPATPATATAYAWNTGTGAMGAITVSAGAKVGDYRLDIMRAASNAGHFIVTDPDGKHVGAGAVGSAFSAGGLAFTLADATDYAAGDGFIITVAAATTGTGGTWTVTAPDGTALPPASVGTAYTNPQINFTLTDSGTNFAVGDHFTITVSGSGKYVAYNQDAVDGSEVAAGVLLYDCTAPDGEDANGVAVVRHAVVLSSGLIWPSDITTDEKTIGINQLQTRGIVVAEGA